MQSYGEDTIPERVKGTISKHLRIVPWMKKWLSSFESSELFALELINNGAV
jgi:hypothetical protein